MIFKTFNECCVSLAKNSGQEGVNYTNQITDNIIYISTNEYSNQECVNLYIIQMVTITIKPGKIYRGMCNSNIIRTGIITFRKMWLKQIGQK